MIETPTLSTDGADDYLIAHGLKAPDGMMYRWRPKSIRNWEWPEQLHEYAANGWAPVPASRHNDFLAGTDRDALIEMSGWVLMEHHA